MAVARKEQELVVAVSPHIRSEETVGKIMWTVSLSLLPAFVMGAYYFGPKAIYVTALCIVGSLFSEWMIERMTGRGVTLGDGSAFLTGLLLGMNLPATVPFYIPLVGSFAAVAITKQLFGGLGYNIFNPALIGRAFVLITWPRAMTTWMAPTAAFVGLDAKTTATPLTLLKEGGMQKLIEVFGSKMNLYIQLLIGHRAGSIGEVSIIAILIGALFLLYKGYITWRIPGSFLATVAVLAWIFGGKEGLFTGDPIVHLLSGGLMLGAFFMATDYVTCPSVRNGQILFGVGCGFLTILIRLKAGYPEGVMFAILLMNCFSPLIERNMKTKVFGAGKEARE
ncbi:electron transport complex protein RnfD [bacterium BMS3Bbin06]|nr:electron transport complex protein RnfD [bacterium BMS3Abin08]GBE35520.1 electron transport complex protein RnfD [bacterium BMS3Bbin06]HDO35241.1 RnfABCDGE type electron transport complex subunit D [Nitrospirota bacterium]HDY72112.1 RnfABCDGE type electron transport complex subunit D [Nitrospirota bacterium]